jgi:hypothetical protein
MQDDAVVGEAEEVESPAVVVVVEHLECAFAQLEERLLFTLLNQHALLHFV